MSSAQVSVTAFQDYAARLQAVLAGSDWSGVGRLAQHMQQCWLQGRQVFLCGNGGSAGNAIHLANDFLYGIAKRTGGGMRVSALSANAAVLTCLANDIGYDHIYSEQLAVQAQPGDLLIALSGSGNSANILRALEQARKMDVISCAILGYSGGKAKALCDIPIHFAVDDMQIAEDMQVIVGHMVMQWLYENKPAVE
ncbi:sedoheptulose 7-phosphate isomerase [Herbaspirillum rubrisubalbicans M1]|uniref:SIS domain-containing protein n=1 Tax=Herbaspirillum rubrisubalbicans TaxID=80842 RepID=UPI00073A03E4|nr:SIS domain-containing protein [Herbaspirillum rubrisubalbicans]ALU91457.1 sedoheptulose 7-phosphate isomerase [Herbaspirillum rubrisubalbicans M1]